MELRLNVLCEAVLLADRNEFALNRWK